MAKRKQKTELQKAYQKERRRLQSAVRRAEKKGYVFPENTVPAMPKRVTKKSLEKIQKTKPIELYKKAKYINPETGEVKPALERREEVKREGYQKREFLRVERQKAKREAERVEKEAREQARKKFEEEQARETWNYDRDETYYPTFTVLARIQEAILNISREAYPPMEIGNRKNALLEIFNDTVDYYTMHGALGELEEYYEEHEEQIASLCDQVSYDSDDRQGTKVGQSFIQLGRILNVTSLSPTQAEGLSQMSEYNLDYND